MPTLVENLFQSLWATVKQRKKQLAYPYWSDHEPKFILLRPLPRPAFSLLDLQKVKINQRYYSANVERICVNLRLTLLNADELNCSQWVLFDEFGNLSQYGIDKLWKSISDYLQRTDRDEYYVVKRYRTLTKTQGTQTFTQQTTVNVKSADTVTTPSKSYQNQPNHPLINAQGQPVGHHNTQLNWNQHQAAGDSTQNPLQNYHPYQYQYPSNDPYHCTRH